LQHGNAKYEHSILRAAGSLDWKPLVEEAAAKFREAGVCLPFILEAQGHRLVLLHVLCWPRLRKPGCSGSLLDARCNL
jgi:hypothetical protein